MSWCGMACDGVVPHGMVWHGMAWRVCYGVCVCVCGVAWRDVYQSYACSTGSDAIII